MTMTVEKVLKIVVVGVAIALAASVVVVLYNGHPEWWFYLLYGTVGVAFFLLAIRVLSVIQKEGGQDD
jgi:hypothetical protein